MRILITRIRRMHFRDGGCYGRVCATLRTAGKESARSRYPFHSPDRPYAGTSEHIDAWCRSQARPPTNTVAARPKTSAKELQRREESVAQAIERHGVRRKEKSRARKKEKLTAAG